MSSKINRHHYHHRFNAQIFPPPCPHLAEFRARNGSKPFRALQDCLRAKSPGGRAAIRRDPSEVPRCGACGESARPRLYACVACAAISCHAPPPDHLMRLCMPRPCLQAMRLRWTLIARNSSAAPAAIRSMTAISMLRWSYLKSPLSIPPQSSRRNRKISVNAGESTTVHGLLICGIVC